MLLAAQAGVAKVGTINVGLGLILVCWGGCVAE